MDYNDDYWLNSLCLEGRYLHDFRIVKSYPECVIEVCSRCKQRELFKNNGSNRKYLSFHIKQTLQPHNKRFYNEYPQLRK